MNDAAKNMRDAAKRAAPNKDFKVEVNLPEEIAAPQNTPTVAPEFLTPANVSDIDPEFLKPDAQEKEAERFSDVDPAFLNPETAIAAAEAANPFGAGKENPGIQAAAGRGGHLPASSDFDPSGAATSGMASSGAPAGNGAPGGKKDPNAKKEDAEAKKKDIADGRKDRAPKGAAASAGAGAATGPKDKEATQGEDNPWGKKGGSENPALAQRPKGKGAEKDDKDPLKGDKDPAVKPPETKSPAEGAAAKAGGAAGAAMAAKDLTAKDPNAGAGGMKAKAAGALQGAQAAIDGFNEGGVKGAALKGAAGARQGTKAANAKALENQDTKSTGKGKAAVKLAASGAKAGIIGFLAGITGIPPEVWAKVFTPKVLGLIGIILFLPLIMIAGLFMNSQGAQVPAPDEESDRYSNEYIPEHWQKMLIEATDLTRRDEVPVPWTVLAGVAKATTDFGRTSPYDDKDHDPTRSTDVKDSPDPDGAEKTGDGQAVSEGLSSYDGSNSAVALSEGTSAFNFNDGCLISRPDPAIGTEKGQARGPFLLTDKAWKELEEEGFSADVPCDVAPWLAKKFGATAATMLEENPDLVSPWDSDTAKAYAKDGVDAPAAAPVDPTNPDAAPADPERDADAKFWADVVSTSGLIQDPSGQSGESCTVAPAADGTPWPVPYLIDQIWNCEFGEVKDIFVVTGMNLSLDNKGFASVSSTYARTVLLREAEQVSYGFSQWDPATCDNSDSVAGIFPLDAGTASAYGAPDRCDVQLNIRAAARALIAIESTPPAERASTQGPYQPMLGGWMNLSAGFGPDLPALLASGPSSSWKSTTACVRAINAVLPTALITEGVSEFGTIPASSTSLDLAAWQPKMDAIVSAETLNALRVECGNPAESLFYATLGEETVNWGNAIMARISPSLVPGIPHVPSNPFAVVKDTPENAIRLIGMGTFWNLKSEAIRAAYPLPAYGTSSLIGERLSVNPVQAPIGETASSRLSVAITPIGTKSIEYAIFYGGTSEPFDSVGMKVGSLAAPPVTAGGASGLVPGQIPENLIPLFMAAGQRCPLITPAVLAAQAKAESGFRADAASPVGARGISQFMPATWEAVAIDGDGDGIRDVFNPADAIPSQAKYMCDLAAQYAPGKTTIPGDQLDLTLAAYNAGSGNVRKYNGIPPFTETQNYLVRIKGYVAQFTAPAGLNPGDPGVIVPVGSGKWVNPVVGPQRSQFGMRFHPIYKKQRLHAGIDISPGCDVPIKAAGDGVVLPSITYPTAGYNVVIDHGGGITTTYLHMPAGGPTVTPGQQVGAGTVIGRVGTTGASTACHLHFEVALNKVQINPVPFMAERGVTLGVG